MSTVDGPAVDDVVETLTADEVAATVHAAAPGHCVRVDDVEPRRATALAHKVVQALAARGTDADVRVLVARGAADRRADGLEVPPDAAVELRNLKARPLVLLVPRGAAVAAGSLDTAFERVPSTTLVARVAAALFARLGPTDAADALAQVHRVLARDLDQQGWAELLVAVAARPAPDGAHVGRELWRVGLVPDHGDATGVAARVRANAAAVRALVRPHARGADLARRLGEAGVPAGPVRDRLEVLLGHGPHDLTSPTLWAEDLGRAHAGTATFELWGCTGATGVRRAGPAAGARPGAPVRGGVPNLAWAALAAAAAGRTERAETAPSWDASGRWFAVRPGQGATVRLPLVPVVTAAQRRSVAAGGEGARFTVAPDAGEPVRATDLRADPVRLPPALAGHRQTLTGLLAGRAPRDTVETAVWDDPLVDAAATYVRSYRRVLDTAAPDVLHEVLLMDTLEVHVPTPAGTVRAVVVLPTHPLRLAWAAAHDRTLRAWAAALDRHRPRSARRHAVDLDLAARVQPVNLPFTVPDAQGQLCVHVCELSHGCAVYLPQGLRDVAGATAAVARALGVPTASDTDPTVDLVRERMTAYRESHPGGTSVRLLAVDPGDGALIAGALVPLVRGAEARPVRPEVVVHTDAAGAGALLDGPLRRLQQDLRAPDRAVRGSHLAPPLSVVLRPRSDVAADPTGAHLALVQDVGLVTCRAVPDADVPAGAWRSAALHDLITTTVTVPRAGGDGAAWDTVASLGPRTGAARAPGARPAGVDIAALHRSHQRAVARHRGVPDGLPVVGVEVDDGRRGELQALHRRADWVVTVDRHLGPGTFDGDPHTVVDYAPDLIEGYTRRVVVTTAQRQEVERVVGAAMRRMGLVDTRSTVREVLDTLSVVSGRLAMRLLGESTLATEAVSLAALLRYLRRAGQLDDLVVIPVDAHPEVLGATSRTPAGAVGDDPVSDDAAPGAGRRCDLLLVKLTARSFQIECVEVKARRETELAASLVERVVEELRDTEQLLESRFFATDPPRADRDLQRARLCGLMHHYADRAHANGLVGADRIADLHRHIDRVEEQRENPRVLLRGYVIGTDGTSGYPARLRGVPITVLSGRDLGELGLTTTMVSPEALAAGTGTDDEESTAAWRPDLDGTSPVEDATAAWSPPDLDDDDDDGEATAPWGAPGPGRGAPGRVRGGAGPGNDAAEVVLGVDGLGQDAVWRVGTRGSPHVVVLGIPGQGKSVTLRRVVRELAAQGVASLVLDHQGDLAPDTPQGVPMRVVDAVHGLPFAPLAPARPGVLPVETDAWEVADVVSRTCQLGDGHRELVFEAVVDAYARHGWTGTTVGPTIPGVADLAEALQRLEHGTRQRSVRDRVRPLTDFGLFGEHAHGFDPFAPGGTVVDLSGLGLEEVQAVAASFVLRQVHRAMVAHGRHDGPRLAVVVDEAHRIARDATLPKLLHQGRAHGVCVVVAGQHPDEVGAAALAAAGTKVVFRTGYPASVAAAGVLRGRQDQDLAEAVEQLDVGCAYVATPDQARARRVHLYR